MELSDIDLNQLVLFQQLMVERRVSKVAENLGLTQPAVSNTLAKLRRQFADDLFVRTPTGMMPTPFAEQLAEPIGYALGMIRSGLNQRSRFDPATEKRSVTIGMTDIGEIVFLPKLVDRLRQQSPGVSLRTVRTTATNLRDDMEAARSTSPSARCRNSRQASFNAACSCSATCACSGRATHSTASVCRWPTTRRRNTW